MSKFHQISFNAHSIEESNGLTVPSGMRGILQSDHKGKGDQNPNRIPKYSSDESVARYFLDSFLQNAGNEGLKALTSPSRPEVMPDLHVTATQNLALTNTRLVKFHQVTKAIPIFGGEAIVELSDTDQRLVSFEASLADQPDVPRIASHSPIDALNSIASFCSIETDALSETDSPEIQYFLHPENDQWHLVYYFKNVPAVPSFQSENDQGHDHGLAQSPRTLRASYDYLVDAHNNEVVYYFSSQPNVSVPVPCEGLDDIGSSRSFFGINTGNGAFALHDPLRNIETYDLNFGDIDVDPVPAIPIVNGQADFVSSNPPGVSAHFYATQVYDFFNDTLKRNGVDDKGMKLVSVVNVTYPRAQAPNDWDNAVWWDNKMWYGQSTNGNGNFESYARYFDIIAHELTHGITQSTSNLVYRDQSGALNESFSDIFGIIVKNWYPNKPNPVAYWDWELGSGLGGSGKPLRDLSNPAVTGDPDHMSTYLQTSADNGGVHTNSNIHNKAAYNLITMTKANGDFQFNPEEIAILYYLTLIRLGRISTFSNCLRTMKIVATTYFSGDVATQTEKLKAIDKAYNAVGIT